MPSASHTARRPSPVKVEPAFATAQPDLFQQLEQEPPPAADYDIKYELLGAVTQAIREAKRLGMSRERIVDAMNLLLPELDRPITLRQLNSWTASSKEFSEFPARFIPSFCAAVGSDLPLRIMTHALELELIDRREQLAHRLGQTQIEAARLRREARLIEKELGP